VSKVFAFIVFLQRGQINHSLTAYQWAIDRCRFTQVRW